MGKRDEVTIGFRYYFGVQMGVGLSEHDELVEIKVGDRTAWTGSVTDNATIRIDAPDLFGGDDKEGGIVGDLDVMMGAPSQPVNTRLAAMLGGLVPAFRGKTTLFFDGLMCSMSAYPKPWKMRMRRILKGWDGGTPWYPAKAVIPLDGGKIRAMNPVHILVQCLTDRRWGRGLPLARLDEAAYKAAADICHAEGFGLCLKWSRQDSLKNFMQAVLDHVGGAQFVDRTTGLIKLRLIRDDYDAATLPLFDYDSGLLSIDDDDSSAQTTGSNEVVVKYVRPADGSDGQVRVQNIAAIQSTGAVASTTKDYPGIPTPELAQRAALRDLRAAAGYIKKFKVRLDRRGYQLEPGSVFRIRDTRRGISNMVLRAGRVDDGTVTDGAITITALQDVFGLPATSYVGVQPGGYVPPDTTAKPIVNRRLQEVPYCELARRLAETDLKAIADTAGYLMALAERPTPLSLGFTLKSGVGTLVERGSGDFCPTALLAALGPLTTTVAFSSGVGMAQVVVGRAALVDEEIVRVDAIDLAAGTLTLGRGCADTVPAAHAGGARIWFYDGAGGYDKTEYTTGVTVSAKLLTRTSTGRVADVAAATDTLAMARRQYRPYAPGKLQINGAAYPSDVSGRVTVSWAHRNRLTQADQLIDTLQGDITPESNTSYTLRFYSGSDLKRTVSGIVETSYVYTMPAEIADGGPFDPLRITLEAMRDDVSSRSRHDVTVARVIDSSDLTDDRASLIVDAFAPEWIVKYGSTYYAVGVQYVPNGGQSYSVEYRLRRSSDLVNWQRITDLDPAGYASRPLSFFEGGIALLADSVWDYTTNAFTPLTGAHHSGTPSGMTPQFSDSAVRILGKFGGNYYKAVPVTGTHEDWLFYSSANGATWTYVCPVPDDFLWGTPAHWAFPYGLVGAQGRAQQFSPQGLVEFNGHAIGFSSSPNAGLRILRTQNFSSWTLIHAFPRGDHIMGSVGADVIEWKYLVIGGVATIFVVVDVSDLTPDRVLYKLTSADGATWSSPVSVPLPDQQVLEQWTATGGVQPGPQESLIWHTLSIFNLFRDAANNRYVSIGNRVRTSFVMTTWFSYDDCQTWERHEGALPASILSAWDVCYRGQVDGWHLANVTTQGGVRQLIKSRDLLNWEMFGRSDFYLTGDPAPVATDPYFANVGFLLHENGVNGATTSVDSGPRNKAISRTSGGQISTAQSVFGGSAWYNSTAAGRRTIAQDTTYITAANATPWTWEVRMRADNFSAARVVFDNNNNGSNTTGWQIYLGADAKLYIWSGPQARSYGGFGSAIVANTWYALRICWDGATLYFFCDGILLGTATGFTNVWGNALAIGNSAYANQGFIGYLDEMRFTKGVVRSTVDYTIDTEQFPDA